MEKIRARETMEKLVDPGTWEPLFTEEVSEDPLQFPQYKEKLEAAREKSGEKEAVLCAKAKIGGLAAAVFAMDQQFMMGTLSQTVGERIISLFEFATEHKLPVIGVATSGGARMQEGLLALMQMARISAAVSQHSQKGLFYLVILKSPTLGGTAASFAMQADVILADPGAMIGFTGAKVISQVTGETLPKGFQRAEFMQEHGFIDAVVDPAEQREVVISFLRWVRSKRRRLKGRRRRNGQKNV